MWRKNTIQPKTLKKYNANCVFGPYVSCGTNGSLDAAGMEQPFEKKEGIYHIVWKIYQNKMRIYPKGVKKRKESTKRRVCSIPDAVSYHCCSYIHISIIPCYKGL